MAFYYKLPSNRAPEFLGSDIDISYDPFYSIVTSYNNPITFTNDGGLGKNSCLKKLRNENAQDITIVFIEELDGAPLKTLMLPNKCTCYIVFTRTSETEGRWFLLDHNSKIPTLS